MATNVKTPQGVAEEYAICVQDPSDPTRWVPVQGAMGSTGMVLSSADVDPGILETRTFMINSTADCFTNKIAPAVGELITATFDGTKKRARVTAHFANGVPYADFIPVTLNAGEDVTAADRLKYTDVGAGGTGSTDTRQELLSKEEWIAEWDLRGTKGYIQRIDMGGWATAAASPNAEIILTVRVW